MGLFVNHNRSAKAINNSLSFILDFLRIIAALTVVFFHAFEQWHPDKVSAESVFSKAAHSAVIIFFIISGFVIAYTTTTNNRGALQYAQARLSRLCSVVIPALLITAVCQLLILFLDSGLYAQYSRPPSYIRYLIAGSFSNEIWFFSSAPPINGPLWSLSYEFWFYTIFGLWLYGNRGWKGLLITATGCLVAGPKILLLMPVWLYGCAAYLIPQKSTSRKRNVIFSLLLFVSALIATFTFPLYPYVMGKKPFYYANQFLTDWMVSFLFAGALWLISETDFLNISKNFAKKFRAIADLTFPVYVIHYPLLILWRAVFKTQFSNLFQMGEAIIFVLLFSLLIGYLLDKQRYLWSSFFKFLLIRVRRIIYGNDYRL